MKHVERFVLAAAILLFLSLSAPAQTVTLDGFLARVSASHPVFRSERLAAEIAAEEQVGLQGEEDWRALSYATIAHEQAAVPGVGPEKTTSVMLGGHLERTLWRTGGRFSATASMVRADLDVSPMLGIPDSYYQTELGVAYAHPLMRNKEGALDRLEYDLKSYDIRSAETAALEAEEALLAGAAVKFLNWTYLTEQNAIFAERLRLSEEELARSIRKRNAYLIDEADVIRAEDAVHFWEQTLGLGEAQWKAMRAELSVLAQDESLLDSSPDCDLYEMIDLLPLEEASDVLSRDSRLLEDLGIRLEQLRHAQSGYEEIAKPDLMLVAEIGARRAHEEPVESLALDKPDVALSLQYGFPLENVTANSDIARGNLEIRRLEATIDEVELALLSNLAAVHTQMTELDSVLALNREQIESARRRTEEELDLYNHGRGELTFVIQARDGEQQARLTLAQNALTYHTLLVTYRALMDELHN